MFFSQFDSPIDRPEFFLKDMEYKNGFLVHLAMDYPPVMTFLRGIYMMMNSWRPGRD